MRQLLIRQRRLTPAHAGFLLPTCKNQQTSVPKTPMADSTGPERFDITKTVILSGWSLSLLVCVTVIGAAVYQSITHPADTGPLKEWAGLCLGFLLATFMQMVKDFISKP